MAATSTSAIDLDREQVLSVPGTDATITVTPNLDYYVPVDGSSAERESGTLMAITAYGRGVSPQVSAYTRTAASYTGGEMHHTVSIGPTLGHIVAVEGVYDPDTAYARLVDTVRAVRVYTRLVTERRDRAGALLRQARTAYTDLGERGRARARLAAGGRYNNLLAVAARVGLWSGVDIDLVAAESGLDEDEMARVGRWIAEDATYTPLYLDVNAVAERIGDKPATVRSYLNRAIMPSPVPITQDKPLWEWRVIEHWQRTRRGQGWAARRD